MVYMSVGEHCTDYGLVTKETEESTFWSQLFSTNLLGTGGARRRRSSRERRSKNVCWMLEHLRSIAPTQIKRDRFTH